MKTKNLKKLAVSGMFVALAVSLSTFAIPIGASKCFPIQHMVNVLSAVILGPWYGVAIAFCTSLIRNLLGTGTLLAFPGSMVGAFCCGLIYQATKKISLTAVAEVIGTGILGGIAAYPLAAFVMGKDAALFTYVVPFLVSTLGGSLIAVILVAIMQKNGLLHRLTEMISDNDRISRSTAVKEEKHD